MTLGVTTSTCLLETNYMIALNTYATFLYIDKDSWEYLSSLAFRRLLVVPNIFFHTPK